MPVPACHHLRLHAGFGIPRLACEGRAAATAAMPVQVPCPCTSRSLPVPGRHALGLAAAANEAPELARLRQPSLITLLSASALGPSSAEESRVQPPIPLPLPRPLLAPAPRVPVAPGGDAHGPGPRAPLTPSRGRSTGAARPASPIQAQGFGWGGGICTRARTAR